MGNTLGSLQRKRRQPDPSKIKKRSDYQRQYQNEVLVGGSRSNTDTGFVIPGFSGKSFETYYEAMASGTSSPVYMHPKKDKTIRVITGVLHVICSGEEGTVQINAIPGDEVVLQRGTPYRLATIKDDAGFFVCQQSKYSSTLEVVEEDAAITREISASFLEEPSKEDRVRSNLPHTGGTSRKGSKAKQQLVALRASRDNRAVEVTKPAKGTAAAAVYGSNPRPSMGNFDPDGAG